MLSMCGWLRHADAATLALVDKLPRAHGDIVHSVSFSPGGTRILSCSDDSKIKLWGGLPLVRAVLSCGQRLKVVCVAARSRCVVAGAGGEATECSQRHREFRGLLARRHEDLVGLERQQHRAVGCAALARAVSVWASGGSAVHGWRLKA